MSTLQQALQKIQDSTRSIMDEAANAADVADAQYITQMEPNRDFETKGKVIKVSDFLTAVHLAAAKFMLRAFPAYFKEKLAFIAESKLSGALSGFAAKQLANEARGAAYLGGLVSDVVIQTEVMEENFAVEKAIRDCVSGVRRELNTGVTLGWGKMRVTAETGAPLQQGNKRKRKDVQSRHYTKPKRRQKGWKSR